MKFMENEKKGRSLVNGIPDIIFYFVLLGIYLGTSVFVIRAVHSTDVFRFMNGAIPIATFSGVLFSLANICIILLVVLFHKPGFWTALTLLLIHFPMLLTQILWFHKYDSLPVLFTSLLTILVIVLLYRRHLTLKEYRNREMDSLKMQQKASQRLLEQTATALVNAIDAKDTCSRGHSKRVAEYSEKIARMVGKDDETCRKVYYTALLHDVGKIGISNSILNKKVKLTPEEYDIIKAHPVFSGQILAGINEYPYLSIGACHHHERYDGRGYPEGLKGENIPEIARIIAVADAYDAMTSNRSYRNAIPQHIVREELVKGMGTQFDPEFAKAMLHLIDVDTEYQMQEF